MKKLILVIALTMAFIFASCSKDSSSSSTPQQNLPATGTFILAQANGANFTTVIAGQTSGIATRVGTGADSLIQVAGTSISNISASGADSATISIALFGITAPGTYTVSPDSDSLIAYTFVPAGASTGPSYSTADCSGSTGTITVTSITATQIEGTFSCTAKKLDTCDATETITQGSFRGVFN